jgi:hypothetical protein
LGIGAREEVNLFYKTMAHGPNTEEIQGLFENMVEGYLDIDLHYYDITSLPEFPQGVVNLFISRAYLPQIPNFPPGLRVIRMQSIEIENEIIPPLPEGLLEFGCIETNLKTLPALPSTLTKLTCYANEELTTLPALPPTLEEIVCSENNLTSLPALPPTLTILGCDDNQLTSLPSLPPALRFLACGNNPIITLPVLPAGLKTLSVLRCNQLTTLPDLPPTLTILDCRKTQILTLPALPAGLLFLRAWDCEQLETLTPPCPEALRLTGVIEIFGDENNLEPPPEPDEMLGDYMDRIAGVVVPVPTQEINIPKGQEDIILMTEIADGTRMADFHDERLKYNRYYTEETLKKLKGKNPYQNKPILRTDVTQYIARLDPTMPVQEAGRRKTRKGKRRARKTYRRKHGLTKKRVLRSNLHKQTRRRSKWRQTSS